jgi:hypothetical protein
LKAKMTPRAACHASYPPLTDADRRKPYRTLLLILADARP